MSPPSSGPTTGTTSVVTPQNASAVPASSRYRAGRPSAGATSTPHAAGRNGRRSHTGVTDTARAGRASSCLR